MNKFFGSKLNTVLLVILIILLVVAINVMLKDKEKYFPILAQNKTEQIASSDLISFSILPNSIVHGVVSYQGVIKGGYFFEANILINILDKNKKVLKASNAMATTDWMTSGPVNFEGSIDFTTLPKGEAFFEVHNDNPSDMRQYDKSVLIPILIE